MQASPDKMDVKMNESVTQTDALTWFQRYQVEAVIRNGVVPQWFHGIISRKASEELLMSKPPGYFLIKVSESRIGYTLSYRAEDCCRHFMIDALKDGYIILGDDRHHRLLEDLVDFHRKVPIKPFSDLLSMPCGQISDVNTDYEELLFPKMNPSSDSPKLPVQNSMSVPAVTPVLPCRPSQIMDSVIQPFNFQPSRLYPSLDHLQYTGPSLDLQQAVPASCAPVTANTPMPSKPPELPSRNVKPVPKKNQLVKQTSSALPRLPKDHKEPMDSLTSVVANLKKFKKKLHNKNNSFELHSKSISSDQALSEEVSVKEEDKSEPEYHETADHPIVQAEQTPYSVHTTPTELPQEYLAPPPFAPGYT